MLDIASDVAMSNGHDADVVKYPETDGAGNGMDHANGEGGGEFLQGVKAVNHVNGHGHTMDEPSKLLVNGQEDSASTNGHSQDTSHSDQQEDGDEEMGDAEHVERGENGGGEPDAEDGPEEEDDEATEAAAAHGVDEQEEDREQSVEKDDEDDEEDDADGEKEDEEEEGGEGSCPRAQSDDAGERSKKRKRTVEEEEDDTIAAQLVEDAMDKDAEEWGDYDDENGTQSPITHAPFQERDPNKPLPGWATDPSSMEITDEEKVAIPEFFCGRPIKTPERYLEIRKHLQLLWSKFSPNYLKKSSCLTIGGDVNAIGRVHSYLESLGVINLDAVQQATPPAKTKPEDKDVAPPAKKEKAKEKKDAKPKSNRWTKAKEARAAKREKEQQREKERAEGEASNSKNNDDDDKSKDDPRKTAWQTRREEAPFDVALEKERRKRKSARTEACLSKDGPNDSAGGYCGGSSIMCLMLPLPERVARFRAMEVLHLQQQETRRLQDKRSMAASRRNAVVTTIVRPTGDDDEPLGPARPQDVLAALDHTTLKKYRRQFRLDMPLQAPREQLATVVVDHFKHHRMPAENITITKFIETVKGRRSGEQHPVANTLENRRAMQKALAADAAEEEEPDEPQEEEDEVFTIVQDGKRIEFTIGAAVQVLYDDDTWYPGEIVAFTETTGKFRFKLTEGSNTRFSEWLPNSDVKIEDYRLIEGDEKPTPDATEPPAPPPKDKKKESEEGEEGEEEGGEEEDK